MSSFYKTSKIKYPYSENFKLIQKKLIDYNFLSKTNLKGKSNINGFWGPASQKALDKFLEKVGYPNLKEKIPDLTFIRWFLNYDKLKKQDRDIQPYEMEIPSEEKLRELYNNIANYLLEFGVTVLNKGENINEKKMEELVNILGRNRNLYIPIYPYESKEGEDFAKAYSYLASPSGNKINNWYIGLKGILPFVEKTQELLKNKKDILQKRQKKVVEQEKDIGALNPVGVNVDPKQANLLKYFLLNGGRVNEMTSSMKKDYNLLYPYGHKIVGNEVKPRLREEMASWYKSSSIVNELVSLANRLEDIGENEASFLVDAQILKYKEASNILYDVFKETGEQFINQVHPGGGPTIIPAKEEGGKVETIFERHKKHVEVATKDPTGKIALIIQKLIKAANKLEDIGEVKAAKEIDENLNKIVNAANENSAILGDYRTLQSQINKLIGAIDNIENIEETPNKILAIRFSGMLNTYNTYIKDFIYKKGNQLNIKKFLDDFNEFDKKINKEDVKKDIFGRSEVSIYDEFKKFIKDFANEYNQSQSPSIKSQTENLDSLIMVHDYVADYKRDFKKLIMLLSKKDVMEKLRNLYRERIGDEVKAFAQLSNDIRKIIAAYKKIDELKDQANAYELFRELWTYTITPLINSEIIKWANATSTKNNNIIKKADNRAFLSVFAPSHLGKTPLFQPPPSAKRIVPSSDSNIEQLQNLLTKLNYGVNLGSGNKPIADGRWGGKTQEAYNKAASYLNLPTVEAKPNDNEIRKMIDLLQNESKKPSEQPQIKQTEPAFSPPPSLPLNDEISVIKEKYKELKKVMGLLSDLEEVKDLPVKLRMAIGFFGNGDKNKAISQLKNFGIEMINMILKLRENRDRFEGGNENLDAVIRGLRLWYGRLYYLLLSMEREVKGNV